MFVVILLAVISLSAAIGTVVVAARDGYRAVPTVRA